MLLVLSAAQWYNKLGGLIIGVYLTSLFITSILCSHFLVPMVRAGVTDLCCRPVVQLGVNREQGHRGDNVQGVEQGQNYCSFLTQK